MIITAKNVEDLRSKLVDVKKQTAGKKTWIYFHNYIAYALIRNYGKCGTEDSVTVCLPKTDEDEDRLFQITMLDGTEYCHVAENSSEGIKFSEGEPDEMIFVKPTKDWELKTAYVVVKESITNA